MSRYSRFVPGPIVMVILGFAVCTTVVPQDQISFKKLGCFTDTSQGFLLKKLRKYLDSSSNITDGCITHCESQGTLFAALTNKTICTCGVLYEYWDKTTDTTCNISCGGGFTCGGPSAATLYQITPKPCSLPNSSGYVMFNQSCYRLGTNYLKWNDAENICVSEGGHLASIHNSRNNYFVISLNAATLGAKNSPRYFWAGGIEYPNGQGFEWVDGTPLDFDDWGDDEPTSNYLSTSCLDITPQYPYSTDQKTWANYNCKFSEKFVCERPLNRTFPDIPLVYQVRTATNTACIPENADKFLNNSRGSVLALYPLLLSDVSGVTVQGRAFTPATATYIHFNTGAPDNNTNPTFVTDTTRNRKVMNFSGDGQLIENGPGQANGTVELSVAVWVKCANLGTSPPEEMVIVSKSKDEGSNIVIAWALTIERGTQYCLRVGTLKYCTVSGTVKNEAAQHVTGVYYGTSIQIIVNGEIISVSASGGGYATVVPDSDYPLVIGGSYRKANITGIPATNFKGELQDVRVYGEALNLVDANYMYSCTGRATTNVVYLFGGADAQLEFVGKGLKENQRVGLSVAPCVGSPIDFTNQSAVFMKILDTGNTFATLPGAQIRKPSHFNSSNTGLVYNLCIATPSKPKQYLFTTGVKITITQVTSVEQNSKFAVVPLDGTTVDKSIRIGGFGLWDGQVIAVSQMPDCLVTVSDATITGTNSNGENATVRLKFEALTAVYYLCWKGDIASPGKPMGLSVHFTGEKFATRKVAFNDGTIEISVSDVKNGVSKNDSYFVPCDTLESLGVNVFYEVVIGDYVDYLIPMVGASSCDVLTGETVYLADIGRSVTKYYYSAISPLSSDFEGTLSTVSSSYYDLGGSRIIKLKNRDTLNIWGTKFIRWGHFGGCCKSHSAQSYTWHLPYTITAYKFDVTKTYFQMLEMPSAVFVNEAFSVIMQQGDIYRNATRNTCTLKMQVGDGIPVVLTNNPCIGTFNYTITVASTTPTIIKLYINDTLKRQLSVKSIAVPTGFQGLSVNKKLKKALGWNLDNDKGKFPSYINISLQMWFFTYYQYFSKPDTDMKPFSGMKDVITVPKSWYEVLRTDYGSWLPISADSEGRFGSGVMNNRSVQYFAFVLYVIEEQNVKFNYKCVDQCNVYISGSYYYINKVYKLPEGYHQVIVKTFTTKTTGPTTGFTFEVSEGYGIAVGQEIPFNGPPGTDVLAPGEFVTEFLTVTMPFEGPFETDYLGKNNSDATVKPKLNDPLFIRVADSGGNFSVRGLGLVGKRMVNYFSAGLLASNEGRITIGLPVVGGSTTIWLDGNVVYRVRGTIEDGDEFGFKVTEGWHQLLIKVYVAEGADDWMFKMKGLESDNTVVFTALQIPNILPKYVSNIFEKPIDRMISPMYSWGQNQIPFNFNNTADIAFSDPTFSLIDVTKKEQYGSRIEINGKNWTWYTVFGSSDPGVFRVNSGSGAANRYYAFAMYFTDSVAQLNLSVMHYSGMGMWMDGKLVLANKDKSDSDIVTINNIEKGWRQFHLRLQTPKDMDLVPLETNDKPQHMCAKNGFYLCTQKIDLCTDGVPKIGYSLPLNKTAYAAISSYFVGLSGNDLCKSFYSSSDIGSAPRYAACCGTSKTKTMMSISIIGYTGDTLIGWASTIPPPPLEKPIFVSQAGNGYTLVTIKGINVVETIYFRINGGIYQKYTSPINVTTFAHISAFIYFNGVLSETNEIIISDLHQYKISRSECPGYVPCAVKLSDGVHQVTSSYVVLVDISYPGALIKVLNSSKYAQTGGIGFTKLLRVFKSGIFMTPDIGNDLFSFRYSKTITMKMIVFPSGANSGDAPGILVDGSIVVSLIKVAPAKEGAKSVNRLNSVPIEVSGGIVPGDFVSFPQLMSNTSQCNTDSCFRSMETANTRYKIGPKGETVPVDLSSFYGDELKCICVAAVGGSNIASETVLEKYYHPIEIPISIKVTDAEEYSTKQELLSFSPLVVSKGDTMYISGYFTESAKVTFHCAFEIVKKCSSTVPTFTRIKSSPLIPDNSTVAANGGGVTVKKYKIQNWSGIIGAPGGKSPFGMWKVVVISDGRVLKVQGTYNPSVAYLPPPPNVVFMGGLCAKKSVNCINGSVIEFIGSGFSSEDLHHNEVILMDGAEPSKTVSCMPVKVTETSLSCILIIKLAEEPKRLIYLQVNVATLVTASDDKYGASLPKSLFQTGNSLVLNGGERTGWTGRIAPNPSSDTAPKDSAGGGGRKTVAIAVGVLFAVVFVVVFVGGIFYYKKNRFERNQAIENIQDPFMTTPPQGEVPLITINQQLSPALTPRVEDLGSDVSPAWSPRGDLWSPSISPKPEDL